MFQLKGPARPDLLAGALPDNREGKSTMQRFNAKDYAVNPAPYRAATRAVFNTSIFTHNGESDIQAGTPTALEYAGDALNKLYRRTEPLYRTPDGRTFYGNVFADIA